ncbi:acyltransferase domain-containing protein, partial [Streptomyces chryseus]
YASHTSHVERIEDELALVLAEIQPQQATVPLFSTLRGQWLDTTTMGGTYWYDNLRHQVRFSESIEQLVTEDFRTFVEISAHPVISMAVQDILDTHADTPSVTTGTLRRNEDTTTRFLTSLATLHVHGTPVDWQPALGTTRPTHVELPTYPFQRTRYWLEGTGSTDAGALGLDSEEHPLLGALVELPGSGGVLATSRLSLKTHPWLAPDGASAPVPGSVLVELAVRAGDHVGAGAIEELTLEAPMVLPERGSMQIRVQVGAPDDSGNARTHERRPVSIHSRTHESDDWVRHAIGRLTAAPEFAGDFTVRPPQSAEAVDVTGLADGLRKVWRHGDEVYAEVALEGEAAEAADAFGMHPTLLETVLSAAAFGALGPVREDGKVLVPHTWRRVALYASGAGQLRVRITPQGENAIAVAAADSAGSPVLSIRELSFRAVDTAEFGAGQDPARDALFRVEWQPIAVPDTVTGDDWPVLDLTDSGDEDIRTLTGRVLSTVQDLLATDPDDTRLVVLTRDAVTVPEQAAVWGLLRTAQNEHPDRIILVDTDTQSRNLLHAALATGEPQLALR